MGERVEGQAFGYADRRHYRSKLRQCLDALRVLADEDRFAVERTLTGMELELNLVTEEGDPAMKNDEVLGYLAESTVVNDLLVTDELGRFNLEFNLEPRPISADGLNDYERQLSAWIHEVAERAGKSHAGLVLVGMLPTLRREHTGEDMLTPRHRYHLLNRQILAARGEEFDVDIQGVESLRFYSDSIAPEAANTSVQFHLQLTPQQFPRYWNASQAVAGAQVAMGANSPYMYGSQLWAETRIALFEQAIDTRSSEMRAQGVRPRTFFGERWINSVLDLFEENLRYFPSLLPMCSEENPLEVARDGRIPDLAELRLHNGTVYRWNRPVYDVSDGRPHLRVENRVLPAGPTPVDICANMAFYLGLVKSLACQENAVWRRMPFAVAEQNFFSGARHGMTAHQTWPGVGEVPVRVLVADHLLPLAEAGLTELGVDTDIRDRLLGIVEGRCRTGVNGASWQVGCVQRLEADGLGRAEALREMLLRYIRYAQTNKPVHEWPPA
ncbi:MAG TPA: glutamate--cysteine ligase [Candidatus Stackebrandtia excrementipullorum]|nr:glutamate--cysteine ligase [Candidatus Stackebrandtia excrementipullorum]